MTKSPPSMRLRIAVSVTVLVLLLIVGQAAALLLMYEEMEEEFIDNILAEQLEYSIASWRESAQLALPNTPAMQLYRLQPDTPLPEDLDPELARLPIGNHEVFLADKEYHVAVREAYGGRFILRYDEAEHDNRVAAVSSVVISGALILCLLVLVLVYALAGRLTQGLENLAARVERGRGQQPYVQAGMERELLAVARALDEAEARQADLLARERDFTANISHELRTPLTGVRTDAELIAALPDLPEPVRRRAARIQTAVDGITELAGRLLALARQAEPGDLEALPLAATLEQIWASVAAASPAARLDLEVAADAEVEADPAFLELVLRNLLENALRHGGGPVTCRLEGSRLLVLDRGPGFTEADLPRVFERFYRSGPQGRHGLGLALVRHVCDASGWQVEAANQPGGGACLSVDFGGRLQRA